MTLPTPQALLMERSTRSSQRARVSFVSSEADIPYFQSLSAPPERWLASDIVAYRRLFERGQDVAGTWDYADLAARRNTVLEALQLQKTWCAELRPLLDYRGIDMGDGLKYAVYGFLLEALASEGIAEKFFASGACSSLVMTSIQGVPARYALTERSDVPRAIFAHFAREAGVSVQWLHQALPRPSATWRDIARRLTPLPLRKARSDFLEWRKRRAPRQGEAREMSPAETALWLRSRDPARPTAVLASANHNFLMLLPLLEPLEHGGWSALPVHTGAGLNYAAARGNSQYADFRPAAGSHPFAYVEFDRMAAAKRGSHEPFLERCWQAFAAWWAHYRGKHQALFGNPLLEFQFRYVLRTELARLCACVDAAQELLESVRPEALVVGNSGAADWPLAAVAARLNIPTLLAPHNRTWSDPQLHDFPVDAIGVRNEATADLLRDAVGGKDLVVIGDPSAQTLPPCRIGGPASDVKRSSGRTTLLVLTGGYFPGCFQYFDPGRLCSALQTLLREAAVRPDWKIVLRPHPRCDAFELLQAIVPGSPAGQAGRVVLETDRSAEELMPTADLAVMLEYSSTPILAAWEAGVPVLRWIADGLFLGPDDLFQDEWFPTARNVEEFLAAVERFQRDEAWRQAWVAKGRALAATLSAAPEAAQVDFPGVLRKLGAKRRPASPNACGRRIVEKIQQATRA